MPLRVMVGFPVASGLVDTGDAAVHRDCACLHNRWSANPRDVLTKPVIRHAPLPTGTIQVCIRARFAEPAMRRPAAIRCSSHPMETSGYSNARSRSPLMPGRASIPGNDDVGEAGSVHTIHAGPGPCTRRTGRCRHDRGQPGPGRLPAPAPRPWNKRDVRTGPCPRKTAPQRARRDLARHPRRGRQPELPAVSCGERPGRRRGADRRPPSRTLQLSARGRRAAQRHAARGRLLEGVRL